MRFIKLVLASIILPGTALAAGEPVITVAETLPRGSLVEAVDLVLPAGTSSDLLSGYVGKETTRTIYAGSAIRSRDVRAPILIRRNSRVSMVYRIGSLEIRAAGRALNPGSKGEMIEVLNLESRKRVEGVVSDFNLVEMNP